MFVLESALFMSLTIAVALLWMRVQRFFGSALLNPLLMTVMSLCLVLLLLGIPYDEYFRRTRLIDALIEPAVVVFGYPLYQQLKMIGQSWRELGLLSAFCVLFTLTVAALLSRALGLEEWVIKSLVVVSTTTPIAMETSEVMQGSASLASVLVLLGGLSGSAFGISALSIFRVNDARARGIAIGAFSHVIGTAAIAKDSYTSAAYSSTALIMCATLTALIAPYYIPLLLAAW